LVGLKKKPGSTKYLKGREKGKKAGGVLRKTLVKDLKEKRGGLTNSKSQKRTLAEGRMGGFEGERVSGVKTEGGKWETEKSCLSLGGGGTGENGKGKKVWMKDRRKKSQESSDNVMKK